VGDGGEEQERQQQQRGSPWRRRRRHGWLLPPVGVGSWAVGEGGCVLQVGFMGGRWFGVERVGRKKAGERARGGMALKGSA